MKSSSISDQYNNALFRLTQELALMGSLDGDTTIHSMAETMQINIAQMRADISILMKNRSFRFALEGGDTDLLLIDRLREIDEAAAKPEEARKLSCLASKIREGLFDHTLLQLDIEYFDNCLNSQTFFMMLTPYENSYLKKHFKGLFFSEPEESFLMKDLITPVSEKIASLKEEIEIAILNNRMVSFQYKSKEDQRYGSSEEHAPQLLCHNTSQNTFYLIDQKGLAYRLDRIRNFKTLKNVAPSLSSDDEQRFQMLWGIGGFEEEPVHVKIQLPSQHLTGNLLQKITLDTNRRTATRKIYEKDGDYYYEDDIIGIESFTSWVRGYGASMIVLEPVSLARTLYDSAKRRLRHYELGTFER